MKNELPINPWKIDECGIINLQNSDEEGSHWTAYYKMNEYKYYFDSYGNAPPPKQLVKYLGEDNLYYNENRIQNYNDPPICGHLCLQLLKKFDETKSPYITPLIYQKIIKDLYNKHGTNSTTYNSYSNER